MNTPLFSRRMELLLLGCVLFLAAVLRLGWPGLTEFKADEARLFTLALEMVTTGKVALRGISSSVGFPNFPMSVWLYALPLVLWRHVLAATLFTALLNTLAIPACYWFVRRYWGVAAALTAVTMWAVSPWAIIFSRKIWAQNLLPFFVILWLISAGLTFIERRPRFIWLHFVTLAVAVQIHLAAIALVPATAVYLLIFRRRLAWKQVLVGGALAVLTAVPFLIYLGQNQSRLGQGVSLANGSGGQLDGSSWWLSAMLSLGTDLHSLAGPQAFTALLARLPDLTWVHLLWVVFIGGGILWAGWQARQGWGSPQTDARQQAEAGVIVLVWLFLPPLFFMWHRTPNFIHYFIAMLPAPYILAGAGLAALANGRVWPASPPSVKRVIPFLVVGLFLTTAVAQVWAWGTLLQFLGTMATPGGFGTPLARQLAATEAARSLRAQTDAAEILVGGTGESPADDTDAAVFQALFAGVPHRFVDVSHSALFPAQPAVLLLLTDDGLADVYRQTAVSSQTIPLRTGEGAWHVLSLPADAAPAPDVVFSPPYLLANWVNLTGYDDLDIRAEGTAVWQIHWRTGDNPDPAAYHFFNHLIDGQGQQVGQADAPAFSPAQWQAGDQVVSRFVLPWDVAAARPLTMRTGMYSYPELTPILVLDVAGNPYSDAVEIEVIPPDN